MKGGRGQGGEIRNSKIEKGKFEGFESVNVGRCEGEKVEKLIMTEPFLGNGSLILDDGISGTRADSMDPRGGGDFGFGPSGVVRSENRST